MKSLGDLATINDLDSGRSGPIGAALSLHGLNYIISLNHLAKDSVLTVQPWGSSDRDEELAPIRVGPGICHAQLARLGVGNDKVLVGELVAIDRLATRTVVVREVT